MAVRRCVAAVVCVLAVVVVPARPSLSTQADQCSEENFNGDARLGPRDLPTAVPSGWSCGPMTAWPG